MLNSTRAALNRTRQRLLDLSKRNPLLNYKEKARTVRLLDTPSKYLVDKLIVKSHSMVLRSIDLDETAWVSATASQALKPYRGRFLATAHRQVTLEQRCKKLLQETRTALEETGHHFLYLAMGTLAWQADPKATQSMQAPLVLMPVDIEKIQSYSSYYALSYRDERIEINLSLAEKLKQDFNLSLPILTGDQLDIEAYLNQVTQLIHAIPTWQIIPDIFLDFFSFTPFIAYEDLNDIHWPQAIKPSHNKHLRQILAGEYLEDQPISFKTSQVLDETPLILEADSSQQIAVQAILNQPINWVIEGPPGTGKSQTIANLIAAALAANRSVLFVAEKKAALEVVKSRLDHVGLGDFCLELHSHKTQKREVLKAIKHRLDKTYPAAPALDKMIQTFQAQRQKLQAYVDLISQPLGPRGETINEIFWAIERMRGELGTAMISLELPDPLAHFDARLDKLQTLSIHYDQLPMTIWQHWSGFVPHSLLPKEVESIRIKLSSLLQETQTYQAYLDALRVETHYPLEQDLSTLQILSKIDATQLPPLPDQIDASMARPFLEQATVTHLYQFQTDQATYRQLLQQGTALLGADLSLTACETLAAITGQLDTLGFENASPHELRTLNADIERLSKTWRALSTDPKAAADFSHFLQLRTLAQQAPPDLALYKQPEHALSTTAVVFKQARHIFADLSQQWSTQKQFVSVTQLPTPEVLVMLAEKWRKHKNNKLAYFSLDYWSTWWETRKFLHQGATDDRPTQLENLATLQKRTAQATENADYQRLLGPLFQGLATDWSHLEQYLNWAQTLSQVLNSEEKAQILLEKQTDPGSFLLKDIAVIHAQWLQVIRLAERLHVPIDADLKQLITHILARQYLLTTLLTALQPFAFLDDKQVISIQTAAQNILTAQQIRDTIETDPQLKALFGKHYQGIATDPALFIQAATWVTALPLPPTLSAWLFQADLIERMTLLKTVLQKNQAYLACFADFCQQLSQLGTFEVQRWLPQPGTLTQLLAKLRACQASVSHLLNYATCYRLKQAADEKGLETITTALFTARISAQQTPLYFKYMVYQQVARDLMQRHSLLTHFTRTDHERTQQQFIALDKKIRQATCRQLVHQLAQKTTPQGHRGGKVSTLTENYLIQHEITKKKRHIPIRQLIKRAGCALKALKPCFMMSPLSVAYYLPPGYLHFDLLIFDEASQVRPEDALSAIARSRQVVVVGDPKQLPPTSFFERIHDETATEDLLAGQASILDIFLSLYPQQRLRWHYRSEHEQLMAFSNYHFYDNNLIIFPSPRKQTLAGVHLNRIPQATYAQGRNIKEAEAIVAAVIEHYQTLPQLSLGIATFNREQQTLINDLIDIACQKDEKLAAWIRVSENTLAPFFVKNLENVQGDERDVIFVSVTYGPDATGRVFQRFGPIAMAGGWRRLNVLFTRAKKRLVLFTALQPEAIKSQHNQNIQLLKDYLIYAETGALPNTVSAEVPTVIDDFTLAITQILAQHGYQTVSQVGAADLRVAIAVCHPTRPTEYVLGIEYDGAAYQAMTSVRDRDQLKEAVLIKKGWKIHRIWSVDWFKNREVEITRLLQVLQQALDASS